MCSVAMKSIKVFNSEFLWKCKFAENSFHLTFSNQKRKKKQIAVFFPHVIILIKTGCEFSADMSKIIHDRMFSHIESIAVQNMTYDIR